MGGSGGSFDISSNEYKKLVDETRKKTNDEQFETRVSAMIDDLLSEYNERDYETINSHLEGIKNYLEDEFGGTIDLKFGGSVKKHTYVNGLSDIDVLVLINKCDLSNLSPKEVLDKMKIELLKKHIKDIKNIESGNLAITITFKDDKKIQLLPAIKSSTGYKISNEYGNFWSDIIRPDKFAQRLTDINRSCGGKVIPVIKLIKGIIYELPKAQQLNGYHIESMAVEIFKSYPEDKSKTPKTMMKYFFEKAKDIIRKPIKDKTGQSRNVDGDLGPENSPNRQKLSNTLDIIYKRMRDADEKGDISRWEQILGVRS